MLLHVICGRFVLLWRINDPVQIVPGIDPRLADRILILINVELIL